MIRGQKKTIRPARMVLMLVLVLLMVGFGSICAQAAKVSYELSREAITVGVGRTYDLKLYRRTGKRYTQMGNSQIRWSSSKRSVATVSASGVVHGIKKGTCTIRARFQDEIYECEVTVSKDKMVYRPFYKMDMYPTAKNKGSIVFAGSSSIARWDEAVDEMRPFKAINMGIGASKVTNWLEWYYSMIVKYNPSAVVLYIGGNDIRNSTKEEVARETAANVCELLKKLHKKLPDVPIYYVSICQTIMREKAAETVALCNELIAEYCEKDDNIYYIDIASKFYKDGELDPDLFEEGLHPSTEGYEIWRKYVANRVKKDLKNSDSKDTQRTKKEKE